MEMSILCISIYVVGIIGYIVNKYNVLKLILALEVILLGGTLLVLGNSWWLVDLEGELLGLYLIVLAGVESIVGLSLVMQWINRGRCQKC